MMDARYNTNWPRLDPSRGGSTNPPQFAWQPNREAGRASPSNFGNPRLFDPIDFHTDQSYIRTGFTVQPSFADMSVPEMYPRFDSEGYPPDYAGPSAVCSDTYTFSSKFFFGFNPGPHHRGWMQKNLYLPLARSYPEDWVPVSADPIRTLSNSGSYNTAALYSWLLNDRFAIESIINSDFGTFHQNQPSTWFGNADAVAPFLWMAPSIEWNQNIHYVSNNTTLRAQLSMLRAKNVPEIQWFWDCFEVSYAEDAFWNTRRLIYQVYGSRIESARVVQGVRSSIDTNLPECLEYTLRQFNATGVGRDRTVDIENLTPFLNRLGSV